MSTPSGSLCLTGDVCQGVTTATALSLPMLCQQLHGVWGRLDRSTDSTPISAHQRSKVDVGSLLSRHLILCVCVCHFRHVCVISSQKPRECFTCSGETRSHTCTEASSFYGKDRLIFPDFILLFESHSKSACQENFLKSEN